MREQSDRGCACSWRKDTFLCSLIFAGFPDASLVRRMSEFPIEGLKRTEKTTLAWTRFQSHRSSNNTIPHWFPIRELYGRAVLLGGLNFFKLYQMLLSLILNTNVQCWLSGATKRHYVMTHTLFWFGCVEVRCLHITDDDQNQKVIKKLLLIPVGKSLCTIAQHTICRRVSTKKKLYNSKSDEMEGQMSYPVCAYV